MKLLNTNRGLKMTTQNDSIHTMVATALLEGDPGLRPRLQHALDAGITPTQFEKFMDTQARKAGIDPLASVSINGTITAYQYLYEQAQNQNEGGEA